MIMHLNVATITREKMPYLNALLDDNAPDVVCFNEYGVDPATAVHWSFPGYVRMAADLQVPKAGVAIFIRNGYRDQVRLVDIRHGLRWSQFSAIDVNDLRILSIYRSPNMPEEELAGFLEVLGKTVKEVPNDHKILIVSDLNVHADWQEYVATGNHDRRIHQSLLDFCLENGLVQMNYQPTRNEACIDVALTDKAQDIMSCNVVFNQDIDHVDHRPVLTVVKLKVWHQDVEIIRPKKKYDDKVFHKELKKVNQDFLLQQEDVNQLNTNITNIVLRAMDEAIPEIEVDNNKTKKPLQFQMSDASRELLERERSLRRRRDVKGAAKVKKKLQASIKNDQRGWTMAKAKDLDKNTDEVWKLINQATDRGSLRGGLRLREEDTELEFRPQEKTEILMTRYASVMTPKTHPTCDPMDLEGSEVRGGVGLTEFEVDEDLVLESVKKANNSWADDHVGLNMYMLKKAAMVLLPIFVLMVNLTLDACKLADPWLTALIAPVPKKGDPTLAKNLRPVTIEHAILRLVEIVVNTLLVAYLNSRNFFHRCQFGFRQGHSCIHNLIDFWSFTTDLMRKKGAVDVVYADTSAAFDRLSHGILLDKLYHEAGVAGKALAWIKAWLTGRKQFVKMGKFKSRVEDVTSSCLQGSCLGTTLWNVYINQLCFQIEDMIKDLGIPEGECHFWLYADDIKIAFFPSADNARKVNRLLKMICKEMTNLHLAFNPSKCSVLTMGVNNPRYRLYMQDPTGNNTLLKRVKVERDLGLMVDADGSFNTMYNKGLQTAKTTAKFLSKVFEKAVWRVKLQTYHSHVFSRMAYASELSRKTTLEATKEYDLVYEHFFKFVHPPKNAWAPFTPTQLLQRKDLFLLHDIFKEKSPVNPSAVFPSETRTNMVTRSQGERAAHKLIESKWTRNLLLQRNIDIWNSIPLAIRTSGSKIFRQYVDEDVLPKMESNRLREDLMSGELRKKWLRWSDHMEKVRQRQRINLEEGLPSNVTPEPIPMLDDDDNVDDFIVSEHCERENSRKSAKTVEILGIYAPYSLLCHCSKAPCKAEVIKFELKYGSLRQFPKAYVVEGVAKDKYGKIRKPFAQRFSGVTKAIQLGSNREEPRNERRPRGGFPSFDSFRQATVPTHTGRPEPVTAYTAGLPPNWDADIQSLFYP